MIAVSKKKRPINHQVHFLSQGTHHSDFRTNLDEKSSPRSSSLTSKGNRTFYLYAFSQPLNTNTNAKIKIEIKTTKSLSPNHAHAQSFGKNASQRHFLLIHHSSQKRILCSSSALNFSLSFISVFLKTFRRKQEPPTATSTPTTTLKKGEQGSL